MKLEKLIEKLRKESEEMVQAGHSDKPWGNTMIEAAENLEIAQPTNRVQQKFILRWPRPWRFDWNELNAPTIYDAENKVVCVLSTGTIDGAFDSNEIIELGKWIAQN